MADDVLRLSGYLQGMQYTGMGIFDTGELQTYNYAHMLDVGRQRIVPCFLDLCFFYFIIFYLNIEVLPFALM